MSKKRLLQESSIDEQRKEDSDSEFQQDDTGKRAKLVSPSDKTLQDLPIELLECILIKAVVMEVKALKLAKCAWKEKADLVIARLGTVCSQWSSTLATNFFRNELHRTLGDTDQETIRLEIVQQALCSSTLYTTMKDEIFLLCSRNSANLFINVFDRNNIEEVKEIIPLPRSRPVSLAACSVSNCVYVLNRKVHKLNHVSVMRIARDGEQWVVSILIGDLCMPKSMLCVAENGSLILSRDQSKLCDAISMYDANGSLQQTVRTPSDTGKLWKIIPKSGGNLVLVSHNERSEIELTEIDLSGTVVRRYQSPCDVDLFPLSEFVGRADQFGRVLIIIDGTKRMELLDSEFNPIDVTCPQLDESQLTDLCELHYNSERNELVAVLFDQDYSNGVLTIFQLKEI